MWALDSRDDSTFYKKVAICRTDPLQIPDA